jgi:hypothetical protein
MVPRDGYFRKALPQGPIPIPINYLKKNILVLVPHINKINIFSFF